MFRKALFIVPVLLLFCLSAAFAEWLEKPEQAKAAPGVRSKGAVLSPAPSMSPIRPSGDIFIEPEAQPMGPGEWLQVGQDPPDNWLGNAGYIGVMGAQGYTAPYVLYCDSVRFNSAYTYSFRCHFWEDDGSGMPGTSVKDFMIYPPVTFTNFEVEVPDPKPEFEEDEHFHCGWELTTSATYTGWDFDTPASPPYDAWWYPAAPPWVNVYDAYGFEGSWTHAIFIELAFVYDFDAKAVSIDAPGPLVEEGETITPLGTVANKGYESVSFDVTMEIDPGGYSSTVTTPVLDLDETYECTFEDWTVGEECGVEYDITMYCDLEGEENPGNDTVSAVTTSYTYYQDFEADNGGYVADPPTNAWEWGIPTSGPGSAHSGENCWGTELQGYYANNANWKLDSKKYTALEADPDLQYWHWYYIETYYDGYNVKLSTDDGVTWSLIYPVGGYPEDMVYTGNAGIPGEEAYNGNSGGWRLAVFEDLPVGADQDFHVRFHFGTDASVTYPGAYIDDVYGICFHEWVPPRFDAKAVAIDVPSDWVQAGVACTPKARVMNAGLETISFPVTLTVDSYSDQVQVNDLASMDTVELEFEDWIVPEDCGVTYEAELCCHLDGDMKPGNDCVTTTPKAMNFALDFEEDEGMFEAEEAGTWEWGIPLVPPGAHSGEKGWATRLSSNYMPYSCWRLYSLKMDAQDGPEHILSYWHQYQFYPYGQYDGYNVKMSTDGGETWSLIVPEGGYPYVLYPYCDCIPGEPAFARSIVGWQQVIFNLTGLVTPGDEVQVRFDMGSYSLSYPGAVIDDFVGICLMPRVPEADLDIDDNDGNLAANTMHLVGPPGAIVVGTYNMVNPEEPLGGAICPNVDYYDGPGASPLDMSMTFPRTLLSVGGGHAFDPYLYRYLDMESGDEGFVTLDLCQSRRVLLQVGIPGGATPNKVYQGIVEAFGQGIPMFGLPGKTDEDNFLLRVEVVPSGKGSFSGFWGQASSDGNLLEWNGLALGQQGCNLYRSEEGSFAKLNSSLITGESYFDEDVLGDGTYEYQLGLVLDKGTEVLLGPILVGRRLTPGCHALYQNFPNPARDVTVIRYAVASDAKVSLKVCNIAGQTVKTLVDEHQAPGFYSVSWKPEGSANGVYFYRLTAGDFSQTRKMVVLK